MSRNHRDRKLTKVQRHIKSGHIGFIPNCPVCMQTSATRRVSENAVEKVDQKPGRTWSADSIYHVDCDSYQGNKYTIVMYNGATGYMSLGDRLIPQVRGAAVLQPLPDPIGVLKRGGIDANIIDEIYDSRYR